MQALNLGCGDRFLSGWENVDFAPTNPLVRAYDLRRGVPYPDNFFDLVYHSHLLEHFSKDEAPQFLRECFRVLKHEGILRVVVPDLEGIARFYLQALERASQGFEGWDRNYDWMTIELYDQAVRERSGGNYVEFFKRKALTNWEFISHRVGAYGESLRMCFSGEGNPQSLRCQQFERGWLETIKNTRKAIWNAVIRALIGKRDWDCLQLGRFRRNGEIHMWMYDSYSLARLLNSTGFSYPRKVSAKESHIPNWSSFSLDTEPDGRIYKADSLYMEAIKL